MFKSKTEKIYKFVYENTSDYRPAKKTILLTARTPVQAVKAFNRMAGNKLINIVEFTEVVSKTGESKQ